MPNRYERVDVLKIEGVIEKIIERHEGEKSYRKMSVEERESVARIPNRVDCFGHMLRLHSIRLGTFAYSGIVCVDCGIKGHHFAVERLEGSKEGYHANLYALDDNGNEIMMTHDHILARALGGADSMENTQTMCTICNAKKSVVETEILLKRKADGTHVPNAKARKRYRKKSEKMAVAA